MAQEQSAAICERPHRSPHTVESVRALDDSQKIKWRHKCAACAYEQGRADGLAEAAREAGKLTQKWDYLSERGNRKSN